MLVHTGFVFRLEAGSIQSRTLQRTAGPCRWAYNHFLSFREEAYLAAKAAGGTLPKGAFTFASKCTPKLSNFGT